MVRCWDWDWDWGRVCKGEYEDESGVGVVG